MCEVWALSLRDVQLHPRQRTTLQHVRSHRFLSHAIQVPEGGKHVIDFLTLLRWRDEERETPHPHVDVLAEVAFQAIEENEEVTYVWHEVAQFNGQGWGDVQGEVFRWSYLLGVEEGVTPTVDDILAVLNAAQVHARTLDVADGAPLRESIRRLYPLVWGPGYRTVGEA